MSWMDDLIIALNEAIDSGEPHTIKVPTEAQKGLGESAAGRMGPAKGYDPAQLTFVVDDSVERAQLV